MGVRALRLQLVKSRFPNLKLKHVYQLRFGIGAAFDYGHQYTGLEGVPKLPLRFTTAQAARAMGG